MPVAVERYRWKYIGIAVKLAITTRLEPRATKKPNVNESVYKSRAKADPRSPNAVMKAPSGIVTRHPNRLAKIVTAGHRMLLNPKASDPGIAGN